MAMNKIIELRNGETATATVIVDNKYTYRLFDKVMVYESKVNGIVSAISYDYVYFTLDIVKDEPNGVWSKSEISKGMHLVNIPK